jgi:hypothetical protein
MKCYTLTEPSEDRAFPRIKVRIESLSDLVFGLALSFGSLILIGSQPQNGLDLLNNVFIFGFSFMIVVMTWLGYSRTIAVLPSEVPNALALNLGLLFCVALEPYLFYLLASTKIMALVDPASIAYAIDAGLMFLFLAGLAYIVVNQQKRSPEEKRLHPQLIVRLTRLMRIQAIVGGIYIASALPIFWISTPVGPLRFLLFFAPILIVAAYRRPKPVSP